MSEPTPIAITGLGVVGAAGLGGAALASALTSSRPAFTEIDRSEGLHLPGSATRAALVGTWNTRDWIPPLVARRMSPPSKFAVVAARLALAEAGLEPPESADESTAVMLSTAFGATSYTQRLLDQVFDEGPDAASPALFTECVANAASGQVAIHCRASGPNGTVCAREAGDLIAVGQAAAELRLGRAQRVLAGGVDEMVPVLHAALDRFRALARGSLDRPETARPFDRSRNGFVAGEGAALLMLERAEDARRRGATGRPLLRAAWQAYDPSAPGAGWGRNPDRFASALRRGLDRNGLDVRDINLIVSGASGSVAGDRLEALALRRAWGDAPLPPILAPKSVTGEYGGGLIASAVLIAGGLVPGAAPGFEAPDPELGLTPHDGSSLPDRRRILVSALASGGGAAWLILESP